MAAAMLNERPGDDLWIVFLSRMISIDEAYADLKDPLGVPTNRQLLIATLTCPFHMEQALWWLSEHLLRVWMKLKSLRLPIA